MGDTFLVRPGEAVPTDGVVQSGASSVNQAPITGESVPVDKDEGATVFAGSINGEGSLEVKATTTFENNTISRIIHMVEEAQEKKGESQRFIERFSKRYSPLVLLAGLLFAVVPPLLFGGAWGTWVARATVFVVAAAPCALVISVPITLVATLGTAARRGVLVKGGTYVEQLAAMADVALMADDLERLAYPLKLAQRNRPWCDKTSSSPHSSLAGAFTLPVAVLAHEVSEFVVIGSGLRMLRA